MEEKLDQILAELKEIKQMLAGSSTFASKPVNA